MNFEYQDYLNLITAVPFKPVRIVTTGGVEYDIRHPELLFAGDRFVVIGIPDRSGPSVPTWMHRVAMSHVAEVRDRPVATEA